MTPMKHDKVKTDISDHTRDIPMSHKLASSCSPSGFFLWALKAVCVTYHDMKLLESEMRWVNGIALFPDDKFISICQCSHL